MLYASAPILRFEKGIDLGFQIVAVQSPLHFNPV